MTAGTPTVSVIVPTRGRPEMVRRAVASILDQDHDGPIEVIVVHDGEDVVDPGEATGDRVDRTVRAIENSRAPGLAGARNSGILAAAGDWIAHCDDDDAWLPGKLRLQLAAAEARAPRPSVITTGTRIVSGDREIDRVWPRDEVRFEDLLRSRVQEIHPSSILATRGTFLGPEGAGLVDEVLPGGFGEDYDWLLRAARRAPIAVVRRPLVRVAWQGSSLFADRWATIALALRYLLAKFPEFETLPAGEARICAQVAFAEAAVGDRDQAWIWARRAIRRHATEPRAYLALLVATGLVRAEWLQRQANRFGRGI